MEGIGSRRQVDELIKNNLIRVNSQIINLGYFLQEGDLINFEDKEWIYQAEKEKTRILFAFNKPPGLICTLSQSEENNLQNYFKKKFPNFEEFSNSRIYPIGRLDKNSRGLLLLTNNGQLCHELSHPKYQKEKEYLVHTSKAISQDFLDQFSNGLYIPREDNNADMVKTLPCFVSLEGENIFRVILKQGYKRQIRKMTQSLGLDVMDLIRVRIGNWALDDYEKFINPKTNSGDSNIIILSGLKEGCIQKINV